MQAGRRGAGGCAVNGHVFTCADCGGVFVSDRPDEDARAEFAKNFGGDLNSCPGGVDEVCDDCYKTMVKEMSPEEWMEDVK